MLQLIQIGVKTLRADLVVCADNGAFQQAPDAFNAVCVNIPAHPLIRAMVDSLVALIGIAYAIVSRPFIRVDRFRIRGGVVSNELVKCSLVGMFDNLQTDFATTLNRSDCDGLVFPVATAFAANLPADISLVNFHDAPQKLAIGITHRSADAVAQVPGSLIGNVQGAFNLQSGDSLFGFCHKVNGEEPLRQGQMAIVKNRAGCNRKLVSAGIAVVLLALNDAGHALARAAGAFQAIRPAKLCKTLAALLITSALLDQLDEIHFRFESFNGRFFHNIYA